MPILALSTSTEIGSVALLNDEGNILFEHSYMVSSGHAEVLFEHLTEAMDSTGFQVKDLDCIAVDIGPGSFTGVRMGLAAAKGIALPFGKKIIGISGLEAISHPSNHLGVKVERPSAVWIGKLAIFQMNRPKFVQETITPIYLNTHDYKIVKT